MDKTYAVVLHTSGTGYVVRTVYSGYLPGPYTSAERIAEYKLQSAAQKRADKLNAQGVS